jgi:hypothetical protein
MFQHKFVEALEDRQRFVFNEDVEACSQEDFVKFLHLSIGCPSTNECAFFNTGETYSALLFVSFYHS